MRASKPTSDLNMFRKTFTVPDSLISEWSLSMGNVVYESQNLRNVVDDFNATAFEKMTTFVRLSDPEMEVCGLDLETYQPIMVSGGADETNVVADEL